MSSWIDYAARLKAERDDFAKRAADRRRDAIDCRRKGRWLDALEADTRAREYRTSRDQRAAELKRVRPLAAHENASRVAQACLSRTGEPQAGGEA